MLSENEIQKWYAVNNISNDAREVINTIRSSEPSRRVQSTPKSVSGQYPSIKMGCSIQFESHKVELPFLVEYENDEDVIEYYDQPPPFKINFRTTTGKSVGVIHTCDVFAIRRKTAGWEEIKPEKELQKLFEQSPERFKHYDGSWHCPPGERYAKAFGLYYRVRSDKEIAWPLQCNIEFLRDYLRVSTPKVSEECKASIKAIIAANPGIVLSELLDYESGIKADDIYTLIARNEIYINLLNDRITDYDFTRVYLYRGMEILKPSLEYPTLPQTIDLKIGSSLVWDGNRFEIINMGEYEVWLRASSGEMTTLKNNLLLEFINANKIVLADVTDVKSKCMEVVSQASTKDLEAANHKYPIVVGYLASDPRQKSKRKPYRWIRKYKDAELQYGNGYIGLLPLHRNKGNRLPKLPEKTLDFIETGIDKYFENRKASTKQTAYNKLVVLCENERTIVPSQKTFYKYIKKKPQYLQIVKREGSKAAYSEEPFYFVLERDTPRHGQRPFEIGHIDHTELDIELIDPETRQNLGRPWLTILIDAYSRRILVAILTFDSPSYRTCMMVLRECVRRYGRLPGTIVVDGGPEFRSVYFETLLTFYHCIKKQRPVSKARYSSTCERLFGTTNTQFVYTLTGNTQPSKKPRTMTKETNPKENAIWHLSKLYEKLCHHLYEVYDQIEHPALLQSPQEAFTLGVNNSGERNHCKIPYNDEFIFFTLPTTRKGYANVSRQGVKINNVYYWCTDFTSNRGKNVTVRFDPFEMGTAYTFLNNHWETCYSQYYPVLKERSYKELEIYASQYRRKHLLHSRNKNITAKMLAEEILSNEVDEAVMLQQKRDSEVKKTFQSMGMLLATSSNFSKKVDMTNSNETRSPEDSATGTRKRPLRVYEEF
jgi:putative transposase